MLGIFNRDNSLNINKLNEALNVFYYSTSLPVIAVNTNRICITKSIGQYEFCLHFRELIGDEDICQQIHTNECFSANAPNKSNVFICPAFLMHSTIPIIKDNILLCTLVIGPFHLEEPNQILVNKLFEKFNIESSNSNKLYELLKKIPLLSNNKVAQLNNLLLKLTANMFYDDSSKTSTLSKNLEIKTWDNRLDFQQILYPIKKEKQLSRKVVHGDLIGASTLYQELLKELIDNSFDDITYIKPRLIELFSLLSRATIQGGGMPNTIFELNAKFLTQLYKIENSADLFILTSDHLKNLVDQVHDFSKSNCNNIMKKALVFINSQYMNDISLENVADYVHLSPSYFSTLFKLQLGDSFTDYLSKVRISAAQRLLRSSKDNILEISIQVGYESQGYFTKTFKKHIGITPSQYRKT